MWASYKPELVKRVLLHTAGATIAPTLETREHEEAALALKNVISLGKKSYFLPVRVDNEVNLTCRMSP